MTPWIELARMAFAVLRAAAVRLWSHPTLRALVAALLFGAATYCAGIHRGRATSTPAPCPTPAATASTSSTSSSSSTSTSSRLVEQTAPTIRTVRVVQRTFRADGGRASETVRTEHVELAPRVELVERTGAQLVEQHQLATLQLTPAPAGITGGQVRPSWAVTVAGELAPSRRALGLVGVERRVGDVLGAELWAVLYVAPASPASLYVGARVAF